MVLTLFLVQNGSVEQTSSITYELHIALTSFVGEPCKGEHRSSAIPIIDGNDLVFSTKWSEKQKS